MALHLTSRLAWHEDGWNGHVCHKPAENTYCVAYHPSPGQSTAERRRPRRNFHIGGYQVCEKWLKDRKGRTLTKDDLTHYQKIVVALSETIRLMAEIDAVIEKHGGWPLK